MYRKALAVPFLVLILTVSAAGCAVPATPSPTPTRPPSTLAPTASTTPTPMAEMPTETPTPSATPLPPPSPTPTAKPPSAKTMALYAAGSREEAQLFTLAADGSTADLKKDVYPRAAVSRDGRWVATPKGQLPTDALIISNLETSTTYTIPVTPDFDPYGMAFDPAAPRMAFLELGMPAPDGTPWAIVVVRLEDGSTTRFQATSGPDETLLPGSPIGWIEDELLIDTFVPGTEQGSAGVLSIALPAGFESAPIESLDRRQVLPGDDYLFTPHLSPEGTRGRSALLYLNRDYDYTPDDYGPVGYDLAVNQLRLLDLSSGSSTLLVNETEGGALGMDIAWAPDEMLALFTEGRYDGNTFASLTLKTVDDTGTVTEVAPVPLPSDGYLVSLDWCASDTALVVVATGERVYELHSIDVTSGESSLVVSEDYVAVLGCVQQEGTKMGNADVLHVRAMQTDGPAPGEGETAWTFHVTVEHPDTGWEDYANGWDVVTPNGQVLKPDPEDAFTRVLLHPHVDEQPFTRSQSGIVIPEGVTEVRVRAHDFVDGYGGQEVVVDLTESSGQGFEVER